MRLAVLFWFYRDPLVCRNRLRLWRRLNPRTPVYGLYGGTPQDRQSFEELLDPLLEDFWSFPNDKDAQWKWRNGDLMIRRWYLDRGEQLPWDSVFVAQWDLVAVEPLDALLPPMHEGEMLISGVRPVVEVEAWWQWTQGDNRTEYEQFLDEMRSKYGEVRDPLCCQFIGMVLPRCFLSRYGELEESELGFLEYKVPVLAQVFGVPLVADTCFKPWWPEEPATSGVKRTERLFHAWPNSLRLPTLIYEAHRPHGRRVFHPFRGIYPHDLASIAQMMRQTLERR